MTPRPASVPAVAHSVAVDRDAWRTMLGMTAVLVAFSVGGVVLLAAAAPARYAISGGDGAGVFGWATGLLALTLGIRHAFDVDHLAAIDNTTRKLSNEGRKPLSVGFFFSLGHSTVVFLMAIVLTLGVGAINTQVLDEDSPLQHVTNVIGPTVSGVFLIAIAIVNVVMTVGMVRGVRRARAEDHDAGAAHSHLDGMGHHGVLLRMFGAAARRIDAPWKMYPLGLLFGLGFDTATEVTLLVLSGAAVVGGLPGWAVLSLPLLFTAGMCFFDTLDGVLMAFAYGWALIDTPRKLVYNLVITVVSVVTALAIGLVQLGSAAANGFGWDVPLLDWFDSLSFLGVGVAALLAAIWAVAVVARRLRRGDQLTGEPSGNS